MILVVISDSHGRNEVFTQLREMYPTASAYLHCGDSECPASELDGFVSIQGNNDLYFDYPKQIILDLDGIRVLLIHGHQYPMYAVTEKLIEKAINEECQLVLYGHTHVYKVTQYKDIVLVNPGSIHYNRDGSEPTYAIITILNGKIDVERKTLSREHKTRKWF